MALGNEASTEPRLNLRLANSLGATNNGGRWRAEVATAAVADLAQWPPYGGGIIVQAELPKESVRCRFGEARPRKRLVHIFDLEDRSERSA